MPAYASMTVGAELGVRGQGSGVREGFFSALPNHCHPGKPEGFIRDPESQERVLIQPTLDRHTHKRAFAMTIF